MILILAFYLVGSAFAASCPNGFESHGLSCYFFSHGKETWMGAYETCRDILKAQLVEVNDEPENAYLSNKTKVLGDYWWIGLTDKLIEGEYVWESSFSPLIAGDYTNWGPGEPDGPGDHDENCVFYAPSRKNQWADAECTREERYICETIAGETAIVGK